MSRIFKSCLSEPPNDDRYVSVIINGYETAGIFIDGKWLCKVGQSIKVDKPDVWCEIDWNDIVFSGFYGELTREEIAELQEKGGGK